jgi:hypothetical protein
VLTGPLRKEEQVEDTSGGGFTAADAHRAQIYTCKLTAPCFWLRPAARVFATCFGSVFLG